MRRSVMFALTLPARTRCSWRTTTPTPGAVPPGIPRRAPILGVVLTGPSLTSPTASKQRRRSDRPAPKRPHYSDLGSRADAGQRRPAAHRTDHQRRIISGALDVTPDGGGGGPSTPSPTPAISLPSRGTLFTSHAGASRTVHTVMHLDSPQLNPSTGLRVGISRCTRPNIRLRLTVTHPQLADPAPGPRPSPPLAGRAEQLQAAHRPCATPRPSPRAGCHRRASPTWWHRRAPSCPRWNPWNRCFSSADSLRSCHAHGKPRPPLPLRPLARADHAHPPARRIPGELGIRASGCGAPCARRSWPGLDPVHGSPTPLIWNLPGRRPRM